ncbi:MAG TPA: hypothetical protein VD866_29395 [Urbifossiella sp.]|nr:hypothetical protein [Urbifossiella sp.]
MTLEGTVVNGQLVFPGAPPFPEGFVVRVTFTDPDDELEAELENVPPPPQTESYEEHLTILRQSIAEAKAGIGLMTVAEAMAEADAAIDRAAVAKGM